MFLILAQFVSELFFTMCKVYQDFYNQIVFTNKIICLICSINLLKSSFFLKFNTFIYNLTTFQFHSFHPTPIHLSDVCLVSRFIAVLFNKVTKFILIKHSAQNNPTQPQFHSFTNPIQPNMLQQFIRSR